MSNGKYSGPVLGLAVLVPSAAPVAIAQTPDGTKTEAAAAGVTVTDPITVTAFRRTEEVSKVPAAITVVDPASLPAGSFPPR